MTQMIEERSPKTNARIAAVWYLLLTVFSVFSFMFVDGKLFLPGDPAGTFNAIKENELLYRLGMASSLVGQAIFLFVGLGFYRLFKTTDKNLATTLLALVIASVPIGFLNILSKIVPLILMNDPQFLKAFDLLSIQSLSQVFLEMHNYGILMAGVFWGLWLLPLGLLVYKSGYFPKIFGVLLVINFAAYLLDSFLAFVFPGTRDIIKPVLSGLLAIGEVPFLLYLLIRGARNPS